MYFKPYSKEMVLNRLKLISDLKSTHSNLVCKCKFLITFFSNHKHFIKVKELLIKLFILIS